MKQFQGFMICTGIVVAYLWGLWIQQEHIGGYIANAGVSLLFISGFLIGQVRTGD